MAIQFKINPRTAIIAGVAVLALAGAGAYFLLFEEAPPPPPPAKVAAKPAAAVGAAKVAEGAAKPAGKPAAKPAAKPMPTNPDQVIAEIVAAESLGGYAEGAAGGLTALTGDLKMGAVDPAAIREICARALAADQLGAEIAASLKKSYDATRMPRFVELLREPIATRMKELESGRLAPEAMKEQIEKLRKSPPPAARAKLIQDLDESMRISEVGAQFFVAIVRDVIDELGTAMRKAGKPLPDGAKLVASQMGAIETGWRRLTRTVLHVMYREASDEELAEYLKLADSETGRWAARAIGDQVRAATHGRTRGLARDFVALLMTGQVAAKAEVGSTKGEAPAKPAGAAPVELDRLVARYLEVSSAEMVAARRSRNAMRVFNDATKDWPGLTPAEVQAARSVFERAFQPAALMARTREQIAKDPDAAKLQQIVELYEQPLWSKMRALGLQELARDQTTARLLRELMAKPAAPERANLVRRVEETTQRMERGIDGASQTMRIAIDTIAGAMRRAGKTVRESPEQILNRQFGRSLESMRAAAPLYLQLLYREASDEELAAFVKLLETAPVRWLRDRSRKWEKEMLAAIATDLAAEGARLEQPKAGESAKGPSPREAAAASVPDKSAQARSAQPAVAAAPAGPPPYRRPDNIRELYSRYNDLMSAVVMRDRDAVRELLADGKSPNARQSDGRTALMVAATTDDVETAQMLLAKGADPNLAAPGGVTALAIARERRHAGMEKLLAQHGAKN